MPGEEFRVALQEAQACGARICFGDRPVQVPGRCSVVILSPTIACPPACRPSRGCSIPASLLLRHR